MLGWLPERSPAAVRAALAAVAPDLAGDEITLADWSVIDEPDRMRGTAFVDGEWVVKFAWSEAAAATPANEIGTRLALARHAGAPPLAEIRVSSRDPVLVVSRFVPGAPMLWEGIAAFTDDERHRVAVSLARTLAALHEPATLAAVRAADVRLDPPVPQATTAQIRDRFVPMLTSSDRARVLRWCDWADAALAPPPQTPDVFLHGDFHGMNLVLDGTDVVALLDFEDSAVGDCNYDFRYLPCHEETLGLYLATAAAYGVITGREIDDERVMAWNVRTVLGDALWRTEQGVALPDGGNVASWIEQTSARLAQLGLG